VEPNDVADKNDDEEKRPQENKVIEVNVDAIADAIKQAGDTASKAVGDAMRGAADAAKPIADAAAQGAGIAGAAIADGTGKAGAAVADAAGDVFEAFGGSTGKEHKGNVHDEDDSYHVPDPLLDSKECDELDTLTKRYEESQKPGLLEKAGNWVSDALPEQVKETLGDVKDTVTAQQLYKSATNVCAQGFKVVEEQAARYSVGSDYVLDRVNAGAQNEKVSSIDEICLLRSYDVSRIADAEKNGHIGLAFAEGAATGAPGFFGLPFNIVFSTFLYFRAVQSLAMFYGYDVKNDPAELVIAGNVLTEALAPNKANDSGATECVGKIMVFAEIDTVKQTIKKGWAAMAEADGAAFVIAQLRALANAAAAKALENAGKKSLEESIFKNVFSQIGSKLTQKVIGAGIPVVGGVVGALFDSGEMSRILTYADIFYAKRFILEKEARVIALTEHETYEEASSEAFEG
jgi:hypothetical protein